MRKSIEIDEASIKRLASGVSGDSVLRCLALSWEDAKEYRSVKQNSAQRRMLIEKAIEDYINRLSDSEVESIFNRLL